MGHPFESVTPDKGRRITRARELTRTIGEIQQRQFPANETPVDSTKTAEELGVYDRLGVTVEEIKRGSGIVVETPKPQGGPEVAPKREQNK